jgi:hypothetical protein
MKSRTLCQDPFQDMKRLLSPKPGSFRSRLRGIECFATKSVEMKLWLQPQSKSVESDKPFKLGTERVAIKCCRLFPSEISAEDNEANTSYSNWIAHESLSG